MGPQHHSVPVPDVLHNAVVFYRRTITFQLYIVDQSQELVAELCFSSTCVVIGCLHFRTTYPRFLTYVKNKISHDDVLLASEHSNPGHHVPGTQAKYLIQFDNLMRMTLQVDIQNDKRFNRHWRQSLNGLLQRIRPRGF